MGGASGDGWCINWLGTGGHGEVGWQFNLGICGKALGIWMVLSRLCCGCLGWRTKSYCIGAYLLVKVRLCSARNWWAIGHKLICNIQHVSVVMANANFPSAYTCQLVDGFLENLHVNSFLLNLPQLISSFKKALKHGTQNGQGMFGGNFTTLQWTLVQHVPNYPCILDGRWHLTGSGQFKPKASNVCELYMLWIQTWVDCNFMWVKMAYLLEWTCGSVDFRTHGNYLTIQSFCR